MKLFDVFPTIEFNDEITDYLAEVEVTKVTTTSAKNRLRVYIVSKRLIHKEIIYILENGLKKQIPNFKNIDLKVVEKYVLSSQYNPENLWKLYRESALLELKNENIIDYELLKKAQISFPDKTTMEITITDGTLSRDRIGHVKDYLKMVFYDRCGFEVDFEIIYINGKPLSVFY